MNEKNPTYRIKMKYSGTPPNETFGWEIYRNLDVLPVLRSQQLFVSRMMGLSDANRSRLQLVDTDLQNLKTGADHKHRPATIKLSHTVKRLRNLSHSN